MAIRSMVKFISNSPFMLMLRIGKSTREFCRIGFVLTAISEGIYDSLHLKPMVLEDIQKSLKSDFNSDGLRAWLDLGVSLGELKKNKKGYSIKGKLSKELIKPSNDTWLAFLQARAQIFYKYIIKTPSMLKNNERFEFSDSYGELFARSSRTLEPVLLDELETLIPKTKACRLLEVGCGSGIYIKRACELNPKLIAVGLELQRSVADFARKNIKNWNLGDRASIEIADIRKYTGTSDYDLITFHNLIYYFPINERVDLLQDMGKYLKPGGELIISSLCQGKDWSLNLLNLWASMTDGCGSLPFEKQISDQLKNAGFHKIKSKILIPSFVLFRAIKQ
ncbi:MAG: methyltransferase domain-containing protein [Bacteroidetes bacterium]|nr:methyltransferase domain-containing protein [Bacteroidota bacterium]